MLIGDAPVFKGNINSHQSVRTESQECSEMETHHNVEGKRETTTERRVYVLWTPYIHKVLPRFMQQPIYTY